jgi:hypothetical protein
VENNHLVQGVFRVIGILLLGLLFLNAGMMLISPKKWFELPSWLRGSGTMTRVRYSSGRGAVEVRVLGGLFLTILGWACFNLLK